MNTLFGYKVGMSRMFNEAGVSVPVTILDVSGNRVCQIKSSQGSDGYDAVQIAQGSIKKKRLSNAAVGHLAKHKAGLARTLKEVRIDSAQAAKFEVGADIGMGNFVEGAIVHVNGTSKGKGFAGAIKRYNFKSGRASHGNSRAHNKPGSIGLCQDPGKVFKGKKMAGHMGAQGCTVKNLRIARVDAERKLLFVSGGVPGAPNGKIVVSLSRNSIAKQGK